MSLGCRELDEVWVGQVVGQIPAVSLWGGSAALPLNVDFNWASEYCRGVDVWPTRNRKDSPGQGRFVVFVFKNYCGGGGGVNLSESSPHMIMVLIQLYSIFAPKLNSKFPILSM